MMVVLNGVELTTTSEDETKWLPFTVSIEPCCTCAKVMVLGDSEPISGAGLALPHSGLRVLLHAGRNKASDKARHRPPVREDIEVLLCMEGSGRLGSWKFLSAP